MAAITIHSDFGAQGGKKSVTVSTFPPSFCHEVMGPDAMILVFWMNFKPAFFYWLKKQYACVPSRLSHVVLFAAV